VTDEEVQPDVDVDVPPVDVPPVGEAAAPEKRRLFRRRKRNADREVTAEAEPTESPAATNEAPDDPADEANLTATASPVAAANSPRRSSIKRDLRRLTDERQEAQFHLGGLALELYRRDALSDRVMRQKALEILDVDERVRLLNWRLEAMETERRQRKGAEPPVAGSCLSCGADFAPQSVFCWRCGTRFAPETEAESAMTTEFKAIEQ